MSSDSPSNFQDEVTSVSVLLVEMAPDKANELARILMDEKNFNTNLSSLYDSDDASDEAKRYEEFLKTYSVEFLGGGNSKNYKIFKEGTTPQVLKIENRLGNPKISDNRSFEKYIADTKVDKPVVFQEGNKQVDATLVVTEYFENASAKDYGQKLRESLEQNEGLTDEEIVTKQNDFCNECNNVFIQMASALDDLSKNNILFPDCKDSNWLIDDKGNLKIADTKSFLNTNEEGVYINARNTRFLTTPNYSPGEFNRYQTTPFNGDKAQAYILGANIRNFMKDAKLTDEQKQPYKELYLRLMSPKPEYRPSCSEAHEILQSINKGVRLQNINKEARLLSINKEDAHKNKKNAEEPKDAKVVVDDLFTMVLEQQMSFSNRLPNSRAHEIKTVLRNDSLEPEEKIERIKTLATDALHARQEGHGPKRIFHTKTSVQFYEKVLGEIEKSSPKAPSPAQDSSPGMKL